LFLIRISLTLRDEFGEPNTVTINLTPEQESRLQAIMSRGVYASVEEVVEAALAAVEQRTLPGFAGTPDELDALLSEGLASEEFAEAEFWSSINQRIDGLSAQHKSGSRS
jgi:Arc/MetJ-type ribon-helix-helix transcriptional regulator